MQPLLSFYTNMPTPYQLDFFNELAKRFTLQVIYFTEREADRQWNLPVTNAGYTTRVLKNSGLARLIQRKVVSFHFSWQIIKLLWKDKAPYVIVNGTYWSPNTVLVMLISYWRKKKVLLYAEPVFPTNNRLSYWVKKYLLMLPLRHCTHGILAIGKKAVEGYKAYGYAKNIYNVPYNIDISLFDRSKLDASKLQSLRERYQLGNDPVLLSSGALVERKGMDTVIRAFMQATAHKRGHLIILGEGPQRPALEALAAGNPYIHLVGFCEKQEVPYYFGLATIFVFASRYDGWGLVINEALAAGLAIVASRETGAAADKLVHGYNGFVFAANSAEEFEGYMELLVNNPDKVKQLVNNSLVAKEEISSAYNAQLVAQILINE
jgi:glycosyltransferase involved in cell wall biosynthesis